MTVRPPQLIVDARMLYLVWTPEDPSAVESLVPNGLKPNAERSCYINQYVVDEANQTSNFAEEESFGAYSLTYLGADLEGLDTEAGVPGRWWTHYMDSSSQMIDYAIEHGVPASLGKYSTVLDLEKNTLTATTFDNDVPIIRTTAQVGLDKLERATGQLRYITRVKGEFMSGRYPFVANLAGEFNVESFEFLDSNHPVYDLRPAKPLNFTFGFYSPGISFTYPGGEGALYSEPHGN